MFEVQGGFKWPLFPLTPSILRDADLMLPNEEQVRFKKYNPTIHTWSKVPIGHIITLTASEHIFLKGYDVNTCQDFDRLLSASQQRSPHFSKNLPYERAQVRQALKAKKTWKAGNTPSYVPSSDDEGGEGVEEAQSKITRRKHTISPHPKVEPSDLVIKVEPTVIDLTMSDEEDDSIHVPITHKRARSSKSSSSDSSVVSVSASSSTPHSSTTGIEIEDESDDPLPAWPTEFYVVDIVQGFEKCEEARRGRRSVEQAFVKHFKVPFRSTTFYNHRRHWEKASAAVRDEALHARRTSAGLWTTFLDHSRAEARESKTEKRDKKKKRA